MIQKDYLLILTKISYKYEGLESYIVVCVIFSRFQHQYMYIKQIISIAEFSSKMYLAKSILKIYRILQSILFTVFFHNVGHSLSIRMSEIGLLCLKCFF